MGRWLGEWLVGSREGERLVGYWLGKEYWGRGIATRALSIFLDQVKMRPLYARVAKHNGASIRVLEKCGFKIIGHDKGFPFEGQEIEEVIMELGRIGGYVQGLVLFEPKIYWKPDLPAGESSMLNR